MPSDIKVGDRAPNTQWVLISHTDLPPETEERLKQRLRLRKAKQTMEQERALAFIPRNPHAA